MKLSEYKKEIWLRIAILKANVWFTFQGEIAYTGNNWAGLASTTFYTISILLFLKILFSNVRALAGYSYQEMLLFFLVAQISYYVNWTLSQRNIYDLIHDVNKGNLDMILTKPVPALFYVCTRNINILALLREGFVPTMAIVLSIRWGEIQVMPINILIAGIIIILGLWILHTMSLLAALPVFWLGESESIVDLVLQMNSNGVTIPLEGFSRNLQITLSTVIPILFTAAIPTSALLNKTNPLMLLTVTAGMAILAMGVRKKMWKLAIKNYTSASS